MFVRRKSYYLEEKVNLIVSINRQSLEKIEFPILLIKNSKQKKLERVL
jgi:hypothetical protein